MPTCCEPKTRPLRHWILMVVALVVLVGVAAAGRRASRTTATEAPAEDPLVGELSGSFLTELAPTGELRSFSLTAAPAELALLDGHRLKVWAYNGEVPGPTFRVRVGDTVRVSFKNELPDATTVHWHGVRVPNAMDGVPGVTQPPVAPGGTFTYEFVARDPGTFWFHPHVRSSEQVERGLFGVLIVEDLAPPPFAREVVWVLDDWKLDDGGQIDAAFNTRHDLAHDGRWGNVITVNGVRTPSEDVRPGERLRLRLLNVANGRVFKLRFGVLIARGVAFDGPYARAPFDPTTVELAPGNRMDVDVTIPTDASGTIEVTDVYTRQSNVLGRWGVSGETIETESFEVPARGVVPSWRAGSQVPPTKVLALNAERGGPYGISWMIAGEAMHHGRHETHEQPSFSLRKGEFSKLSFVNESSRIHPMHLHGTFFKVLSRNGAQEDEPFFRDTVLVRARERVEIGLVPLDEGTWMMHCHILEHAESGMMTLFRVE